MGFANCGLRESKRSMTQADSLTFNTIIDDKHKELCETLGPEG